MTWHGSSRKQIQLTLVSSKVSFYVLLVLAALVIVLPRGLSGSVRRQSNTQTLPPNATPPPLDSERFKGNVWSDQEVVLTLAVMSFGLVVIGAELFLLRRLHVRNAEDILRIFGVTLILIGALFLITAGYSAEQISPALGLLGTVAGYLLGKTQSQGGQERQTEQRP